MDGCGYFASLRRPFFNEYPILGVKSLDFADFKKVAELVKNKEHLTESGFSEILKIVQQMNLDRNYSNSRPPFFGRKECVKPNEPLPASEKN